MRLRTFVLARRPRRRRRRGRRVLARLGAVARPRGLPGQRRPAARSTSTPSRAENATLIAAIGVRRGLPARAVSIALATAYQESKIRNLTSGDRDSLGLFQQRPSQGWGTPQQISNPYYSINAFYDVLAKIENYQSMRITDAAQKVQRSGFPEAYQDHAPDARTLASVLTGYSPGGKFTCVVHQPTGKGTGDRVVRQVKRAYGNIDIARTGTRQDVALDGQRAPPASAWAGRWRQFVVAHGGDLRAGPGGLRRQALAHRPCLRGRLDHGLRGHAAPGSSSRWAEASAQPLQPRRPPARRSR